MHHSSRVDRQLFWKALPVFKAEGVFVAASLRVSIFLLFLSPLVRRQVFFIFLFLNFVPV
jgi:hypothetical protein